MARDDKFRRQVVLWSGGLDSTILLHKLALQTPVYNEVVALSVSDHMGARHAQFARQALARKRYLKFAKQQGLHISYQEIQVFGSAVMSNFEVFDYIEQDRKLAQLREWQVFAAWILPFLKSGDQVYLGYEPAKYAVGRKPGVLFELFLAYSRAVDWPISPKIQIPVLSYQHMRKLCLSFPFPIPRNCMSSCDGSNTLNDCGNCVGCKKKAVIVG